LSTSLTESELLAPQLSLSAKARLAARIWRSWVRVRLGVRTEALPELATRLGRSGPRAVPAQPPERLSRAVHRSLRFGPRRPSCLTSALVLFCLLREQGDNAELVIGLPAEPVDHEAHAWVELEGIDVGPPPGRGQCTAMARFGS
jgi:Transglutaminase-like superfamily